MISLSALKRTASALALLGLAAGCSMMPHQRPTPPPMPTAWSEAATNVYGGQDALLEHWWTQFNDPMLDQLITEGLERSTSVRQAVLRVKEARAQSGQTLGQYLPEVNGQARGNFTRDVNGPNPDAGTGSYGATISWEIPLFARIEAARIGARANNRAALEDERGAKAALTADLAQAYVDLRTAQNRLAALRESAAISEEVSRILRTSADAGFASISDAEDARRQAESTNSQIPDGEIEVRRAINQIAVLRSHAPGTDEMTAQLMAPSEVPTIALTGAPAAPADLIRLRPDVASAEAQAIVAAAQVGVARADLLPRLNLTGSILSAQTLVGTALGPDATTGVLTPLITIPLLDWGNRAAAVRAKKASFERALVSYEAAVYKGVSEASLSLTQLNQGTERLRASRAAEQAAEATAKGTRASFGAGIANLTDRLRADQQLLDAKLRRIQAESQQAGAAIAVYRSFGGGAPTLADAIAEANNEKS